MAETPEPDIDHFRAKLLAARAEQSLRRIEAALRRCDDGSYGECQDCGEFINPRRLELDPAATLCIACAEARG